MNSTVGGVGVDVFLKPYRFAHEIGFDGDYGSVVEYSEWVASEPDKILSMWRIIQTQDGQWVSWKSVLQNPVYDVQYHPTKQAALRCLRTEFDALAVHESFWFSQETPP